MTVSDCYFGYLTRMLLLARLRGVCAVTEIKLLQEYITLLWSVLFQIRMATEQKSEMYTTQKPVRWCFTSSTLQNSQSRFHVPVCHHYSHEWVWPVKRPYFRLYLLKCDYSLLDASVEVCSAGNNILRSQVAVFFVLFISGQRRHLCTWTIFIIELTWSTSTSKRNSKKRSCFQVSFFMFL